MQPVTQDVKRNETRDRITMNDKLKLIYFRFGKWKNRI